MAYGYRFASSFGIHVVNQTVQSGLAALLHEDNRYVPSTCPGFGPRFKYALISTVRTRSRTGARRVSISKIAAIRRCLHFAHLAASEYLPFLGCLGKYRGFLGSLCRRQCRPGVPAPLSPSQLASAELRTGTSVGFDTSAVALPMP